MMRGKNNSKTFNQVTNVIYTETIYIQIVSLHRRMSQVSWQILTLPKLGNCKNVHKC